MRVLLLLLAVLSISPVYAQDLITEDKSSEIKLIVDSDPADAEVYLDGKLYGMTPLSVKGLSPGTYEVQIKKESFNTFTQKTEVPALGYKEVFRVLGGKYALLNLESSVTGAEVFMGDSLLGTTPFLNVHIPLGKHTIKVKSKDYFDWHAEVNALPTQYNFKAVMKYVFGYLTLTKNVDGSEIFIDDIKVDAAKLNNYKVEAGNHTVEVRNPSFHKPLVEELLITSEKSSSIQVKAGYFSFKSFFKSLFVPGLGQYQDNSKLKGIGIFSGALLSGLLWLDSKSSANEKLKDYENAKVSYAQAGDIKTIMDAHTRLASTYDEARKSNRIKNISMGTFIAIYAYNLLDALIFHSDGQNLTITHEKPSGNSFNIGFSLVL